LKPGRKLKWTGNGLGQIYGRTNISGSFTIGDATSRNPENSTSFPPTPKLADGYN
jgi:hypothetical protein